jgi:GNAT superfamily N-acetyltransferase
MARFPLRFRVAAPADVRVVAEILTEAGDWEVSMGFPTPWPRPFPAAELQPSCTRGELYLVEDSDNETVGTITLQWADVPFWGEQPPEAGYIHRLAIRRAHGGQGVGRQMIEWAAEKTKAQGRWKLRLDCTQSGELHQYYRSLGFVPVGEVTLRGLRCTLFERSLR